jgi:predicted transcriptional regulator of viral defense system
MALNLSQRLKILTDSKRTVFTTKDLESLWKVNPKNAVIVAKRMVKKGLILKLAKGYYALNKEYNIYELANLIVSPSYVSFNSALFYWNVCFQISDTINSVALFNYEKKIEDRIYKYFAMKKKLFFNLEGISQKDNISIASAERAILDSFYFGLLMNIDNPGKINLSFLKKISLFYPKSVQKKVKDFIEKYGS